MSDADLSCQFCQEQPIATALYLDGEMLVFGCLECMERIRDKVVAKFPKGKDTNQ